MLRRRSNLADFVAVLNCHDDSLPICFRAFGQFVREALSQFSGVAFARQVRRKKCARRVFGICHKAAHVAQAGAQDSGLSAIGA